MSRSSVTAQAPPRRPAAPPPCRPACPSPAARGRPWRCPDDGAAAAGSGLASPRGVRKEAWTAGARRGAEPSTTLQNHRASSSSRPAPPAGMDIPRGACPALLPCAPAALLPASFRNLHSASSRAVLEHVSARIGCTVNHFTGPAPPPVPAPLPCAPCPQRLPGYLVCVRDPAAQALLLPRRRGALERRGLGR